MSQISTPANLTSGTTLDELMGQALSMELEAAQRYSEFADMMETHNSPEVAQWFRKMAVIEGKHATQIMTELGWTQAPSQLGTAISFEGFEAPETAPLDEVHYLMRPWHVLQLALANEERAARFFGHLAGVAGTDPVRNAALQLQEEELEHVALVKAWMLKVPRPEDNWDHDPDPPRID